MKKQRILSFFFSKEEFQNGPLDVNKKVYEVVPEDDIDNIKYIMQSATDNGIYISVVYQEAKQKHGVVGFTG